MGAHNGYGNGHGMPDDIIQRALNQSAQYTISVGQRWKCPKCGDEPPNPGPGIPAAQQTQLDGDEIQYHCLPCLQRAMAERQVKDIREMGPRLQPIIEIATS